MRTDYRYGIIIGFFLFFLLIVPSVNAASLADKYFGEGINYSSNGQYADALTSFDKAVFISPGNADAWNYRGIALENLGQYSEAASSYDKALTLQPMYAEAWYNRGIALRKMERYADAVTSYDKALTINPSNAEAWLNRGVALDYMGRYEESVASYDKALDLQPNFTTARENREIALSKKDRINPMTIGGIVFLLIIVAGLVYWYVKIQPGTKKAPDQIVVEERRPEENWGTEPFLTQVNCIRWRASAL